MANSSPILTYALIGGAAYLAYQWWISQPVATTTTTTGGGTTPPVPPTCAAPNTVVNGVCTPPAAPVVIVTTPKPIPTAPYSAADQSWAMQMAAAANANTLDIDQWGYYFNNLAKTTWKGTRSPISADQEGAMLATLASLGLTESTPMTLPQWYWLVT